MNISQEYRDISFTELLDKSSQVKYLKINEPEKWIIKQVRYNDYNVEFKSFCKEHNIKLPILKSKSGQVLALFTDQRNRYIAIDRVMINGFLSNINEKSKDCIQLINKVEQRGIKKITIARKYYMLIYPFVYYGLHVNKRLNFSHHLDYNQKTTQIETTKQFLLDNYINIENEKWQIGHRDPSGNNSKENLVYQPPIQGKYRDRFKYTNVSLTHLYIIQTEPV